MSEEITVQVIVVNYGSNCKICYLPVLAYWALTGTWSYLPLLFQLHNLSTAPIPRASLSGKDMDHVTATVISFKGYELYQLDYCSSQSFVS